MTENAIATIDPDRGFAKPVAWIDFPAFGKHEAWMLDGCMYAAFGPSLGFSPIAIVLLCWCLAAGLSRRLAIAQAFESFSLRARLQGCGRGADSQSIGRANGYWCRGFMKTHALLVWRVALPTTSGPHHEGSRGCQRPPGMREMVGSGQGSAEVVGVAQEQAPGQHTHTRLKADNGWCLSHEVARVT